MMVLMTPPRMRITWEVLKAAKDAGDEMVIAACRRIIVAHRLGWRNTAILLTWNSCTALRSELHETLRSMELSYEAKYLKRNSAN